MFNSLMTMRKQSNTASAAAVFTSAASQTVNPTRQALQSRSVLLRRVMSLMDRGDDVVDLTCHILQTMVKMPLEDPQVQEKVLDFFSSFNHDHYDYAESVTSETDDDAFPLAIACDCKKPPRAAAFDYVENAVDDGCLANDPYDFVELIEEDDEIYKISVAKVGRLRPAKKASGDLHNKALAFAKLRNVVEEGKVRDARRMQTMMLRTQKRLGFNKLKDRAFKGDTRRAFCGLRAACGTQYGEKQDAFTELKIASFARKVEKNNARRALQALKQAREMSEDCMALKKSTFDTMRKEVTASPKACHKKNSRYFRKRRNRK